MKVGLLSAAYPPDLDGIGDYTWWMAQALAAHPEVETPVEVVTSAGEGRPVSEGVRLHEVLEPFGSASFRALPGAQAVSGLDWLVLQYNPFCFGRRGFCPWVPSTLSRLKRLPVAPRIAVMFHETAVPRWPWKFTVMHAWQQPIFRAVCRIADLAFVSTARWAPQVRRAAPGLRVHHLPVGSNVPLSSASREEARRSLGIPSDALVLGLFGSAHISRRLDWIAATMEAARQRRPGRSVLLLYVGAEGAAVREACPGTEVHDAGFLPPAEVGHCLRAMDAMISPFIDGLSTRRGSVMAALQHGTPVATTRGMWTDDVFLHHTPSGLHLSSAASAASFARGTLQWLEDLADPIAVSGEITAFHDRHFSWPMLAVRMVDHLEWDRV